MKHLRDAMDFEEFDSEGFTASVSEDVAGAIREAARLAGTYADATTARVAVLTGKAVGPVYTALANADLTIAVQGCTVSAVDPKVAVTVLYKDELDASDNIVNATAAKASAYAAESCSADAALAAGVKSPIPRLLLQSVAITAIPLFLK